jgi:hypothetical protein
MNSSQLGFKERLADGLNSATNYTTAQSQDHTQENCSQIPEGPSNLTSYLQRDEYFERRSIGEPAPQDANATAQNLNDWERHWKSTTTNQI